MAAVSGVSYRLSKELSKAATGAKHQSLLLVIPEGHLVKRHLISMRVSRSNILRTARIVRHQPLLDPLIM
jgi:hypothetical protein